MEVSIVLFHGTPEGCGGCSFGGCGPQAFAFCRSPAPSVRLAADADWKKKRQQKITTHARTHARTHSKRTAKKFLTFSKKKCFVNTRAEEQSINLDDGIFTGGGRECAGSNWPLLTFPHAIIKRYIILIRKSQIVCGVVRDLLDLQACPL